MDPVVLKHQLASLIILKKYSNQEKWVLHYNTLNKISYPAEGIIRIFLGKYPKLDFIFGSVRKHWGVVHGYKPEKIKYSWGVYSSHSTGFFITKKAAKKNGLYKKMVTLKAFFICFLQKCGKDLVFME